MMVELYADSADEHAVRNVLDVIDGVTTNPSTIKTAAKHAGSDLKEYLKQFLRMLSPRPVNLEVVGLTEQEMTEQGLILYRSFVKYNKNLVIKVPVNPVFSGGAKNHFGGLNTIKKLSSMNIPVNTTLVFSVPQAVLAAKAGAKYVSPFTGRVDDFLRHKAHLSATDKNAYFSAKGIERGKFLIEDNGILSGVDLVSKIVQALRQYKLTTKVLAASVRNARQASELMLAGADIITVPPEIIPQLVQHVKTSEGMQKFFEDTPKEYRALCEKKGWF